MASLIDVLWILACPFFVGPLTFISCILFTIFPVRSVIFAPVVNLWPAPSIERCNNQILPLFMVLKWRWITAACIGVTEAAKETADCKNRPSDVGDRILPEKLRTMDLYNGISDQVYSN